MAILFNFAELDAILKAWKNLKDLFKIYHDPRTARVSKTLPSYRDRT